MAFCKMTNKIICDKATCFEPICKRSRIVTNTEYSTLVVTGETFIKFNYLNIRFCFYYKKLC